MISTILGGIGLFLLGMVLMTEGLKSAAGDALRRLLTRFTGGPLRAFASGAAVTLVVQSSSATVLATIGFVSAGLLGFTPAIGVVFGAAVGTTSTGWIVSLLGLRLQISVVALPLVGIGALMRLLARDRIALVGMALAGFGLIFVGIDTLQQGMQTLSAHLDPAMLPGDSAAGKFLLVAAGVAMTVVMQSSSAGVATTLAALHAGTIHLDQAALLVVGHNMGTAVTAALASIGATVAARRTALAHVLFNGFAGLVGLLMLPLFLHLAAAPVADLGDHAGATAIALFHTGFNLTAVAVLLPLIGRFTTLVARLIPEKEPPWSRSLDLSVAEVGPVAVEAARRATLELGALILEATQRLLATDPARGTAVQLLDTADAGLAAARRFLGTVRTSRSAPAEYRQHLAVLHALDHFDRMTASLREAHPMQVIASDTQLRRFADDLVVHLDTPLRWLRGEVAEPPLEEVRCMSREIADVRRTNRPRVMAQTATGETTPEIALAQLDAMRWLDRIAYHVWRAVEHLGGEAAERPQATGFAPAEPGADERA